MSAEGAAAKRLSANDPRKVNLMASKRAFYVNLAQPPSCQGYNVCSALRTEIIINSSPPKKDFLVTIHPSGIWDIKPEIALTAHIRDSLATIHRAVNSAARSRIKDLFT